MSRDWQKDMELFEEGIKQARESRFYPTTESSPYQIAIYWLQQYAAEKERAEKLQDALEQAQVHLSSEHYMTAEDIVYETLASLYPKEGETNE